MIGRLVRSAVVGFLLVAVPASVGAQERRGGPAGDFDHYVLALSWSSGFCAVEGDRRGRDQCRSGSGLGFVVHGLWPQFESGWPAFCQTSVRNAPPYAVERARGVIPEDGLARYQWTKHGTCSGLTPLAYFEATRAARDKVRVPAEFVSPRAEQRFAPIEIERAFAAANPGLTPAMMSVVCERSILEEVRVCLSRDLRSFVPCPGVDRFRCRSAEIAVPPVR